MAIYLEQIQSLAKEIIRQADMALDEGDDDENPTFEADIEDTRDGFRQAKIILEVGHGPHPDGFEPGAVDERTGVREWDMNKICARACRKTLTELGYKDVEVTDIDDYLGSIGALYADAEVFVSVHHNAFSDPKAQGAEVLVHQDYGDKQDERLAQIMSEKLATDLDIPNRGVKRAKLGVLRGAIQGSDKPGRAVVLAEPYFITAGDISKHSRWSELAGESMAGAIHAYLLQVDA